LVIRCRRFLPQEVGAKKKVVIVILSFFPFPPVCCCICVLRTFLFLARRDVDSSPCVGDDRKIAAPCTFSFHFSLRSPLRSISRSYRIASSHFPLEILEGIAPFYSGFFFPIGPAFFRRPLPLFLQISSGRASASSPLRRFLGAVFLGSLSYRAPLPLPFPSLSISVRHPLFPPPFFLFFFILSCFLLLVGPLVEETFFFLPVPSTEPPWSRFPFPLPLLAGLLNADSLQFPLRLCLFSFGTLRETIFSSRAFSLNLLFRNDCMLIVFSCCLFFSAFLRLSLLVSAFCAFVGLTLLFY